MVETTQINKFRQKRLRNLANKVKEDNVIGSYFYPKNNLYTRQEFELLDSIYSDEPSGLTENAGEKISQDNFWQEDKEEYLRIANRKGKFFEKLTWFLSGVAITSVVWLIFFQVNIHKINSEDQTQIVFHKTANIVTDKTADAEVTNKLENQKAKQNNFFSNWFTKKPKTNLVPQQVLPTVKSHMVSSGDSLWSIANKYYSSPTQENINKIMRANNIKKIGLLSIGQKLVIP